MKCSSLTAIGAIARHARSTPQSPALIEPDGPTLSYKRLWEDLEALTLRLIEAGIAPRERVGVVVAQGSLQVLAVTGVMNHHVAIPLNPAAPISDKELAFQKLGASALLVGPEFEAEIELAMKMGLTVVVARENERPNEWQIRTPSAPLRPQIAHSREVAFFNTSGTTTSTAKIVPLTYETLNAATSWICDFARLNASDRELLIIPQYLGPAPTYALPQFIMGGVVIATRGFDSHAYVHWLNDLKPTWYLFSPAVHQAAIAQLKITPPNRPTSLRFVAAAGSVLYEETRQELEAILGVPVMNTYGCHEALNISADPLPPSHRIPGSVGRSCGLEIGIMSSANRLLPNGEEGEILVRGASVMPGYIDNEELNRSAFFGDWYRTGDSGRLDSEGFLFVTGRLKEMINRGGEKIFPCDVDQVMTSHPDVADAAAFAVPHPTLGEDVACAVVLKDGTRSNLSPVALRQFAAKKLTRYKVPHRIYIVDSIPRAGIGKVQRWRLSEQFGSSIADPPAPEETWDPDLPYTTNDLRFKIREIWARVLDRDNVSLEEDFFEAGGDSLAAINMLFEVDQRCGSQTSAFAASFIDEPTIPHLIELIGVPMFLRPTYGESNKMQIFPVGTQTAPRRIYCVPADEDEGLYFRRLAKHLAGQLGLSIVRPSNTFFSRSLFTFESAAAEMVELILKDQPQGTYFIGGFCFGGIVAFEAARQLTSRNRDVRLVLFDTPMPGYPTYFGRLLNRLRGTHSERTVLKGSNGALENERRDAISIPSAQKAKKPIRVKQIEVSSARAYLRRGLWYLISPIRPLLRAFETQYWMQEMLRNTEEGYFPLYRAKPIEVPVLHFLCNDEPSALQAESRLGWRTFALKGIDEQVLPLDHMNVFHESNLQTIIVTLMRWIEAKDSNSVHSG